MPVPSDQAAHRLIGDRPLWQELQSHANSTDRRVRQAALDAAARASDVPPAVRQVLIEVCLDHSGRATAWTSRFHRLRPSGNSTRFVADVLQQAASDPVPYLTDLLAAPGAESLAGTCLHHQSAPVRAMARAIAGVLGEPSVSRPVGAASRTW